MSARQLLALLSSRDYVALELKLSRLALVELAKTWAKLSPLDKLVAFKLLDAPRALEFYALLPFNEKYFLLCGFPLQSIAPVLEGLPLGERRRFVSLPREFYERMFRQLVAERVETS